MWSITTPAKAGDDGPTYSYRGIDNQSYYLLTADRSHYRNDTGCGNTLRCDHPVVRSLILESLLFWIEQMKVDGFRFDLASVFTRRSDGGMDLDHPSLISDISFLGGAARRADDRGSVGHRKLPAGPGISRHQLASVERKVSRRSSRFCARRLRGAWER